MFEKFSGFTILLLIAVIIGFVKEAHIEANETGAQLYVVAPDAKVEKRAGGFRFTEGPAGDTEGNILFTDPHKGSIYKLSPNNKVSTFIEDSGRAIGLFFDKDGSLLACEGGNRRLVSIDSLGKVTVLADRFEGKRLNQPNDLWIGPKGGVYFSDPNYRKGVIEQDGEHVYYITPDRSKIICVIDDMVRPNGLVGSPDGTLLYVIDCGEEKTFVYSINPDGTVSNKKLFAPEGYDGMTVDNKGNIYITARSISVYNPAGTKIGTIEVPEQPSNVCFGGRNKQTLFITTRSSLYSVRMRVSGM